MYFLTCTPNVDSNQPVHPQSDQSSCPLEETLAMTLIIQNALSEYLDQTSQANLNLRLAYIITKTYLYNFDPLKPHFYIVKLGFIGVYISSLPEQRSRRALFLFLIFALNIDCGYSL